MRSRLFALLLTAGCATTSSTPDPPAPPGGLAYSPDWDGVVALIEDSCVVCHVEGGSAAALPLPYALQLDLTRGDGVLVVPLDPDASRFWAVLTGDGVAAEEVMPLGAGPLESSRTEHVRAWIESGAAAPTVPVDGDGDGFTAEGGDCDDTDRDVSPAAVETCDGIDEDCDGTIDGAESVGATPWYPDTDADGFGDLDGETLECAAPPGFVAISGDCDDGDPLFNPGATESCADTSDYNCDGSVGAVDNDRDGFLACQECDDGNRDIFPGATETCNGADDDCDGAVDAAAVDASAWWPDVDRDGYGDRSVAPTRACSAPAGSVPDGTDCDDRDPLVNPGIPVDTVDGNDSDCDGTLDEDGAAPDFRREVQPIFDASCVRSCHEVPTPSGGVDLSGNAYSSLVGVPSGQAAGLDLVAPFDTATSYLWAKVNGDQLAAGGSGTRMPKPPDPALSNAELATIESWILAGAPP